MYFGLNRKVKGHNTVQNSKRNQGTGLPTLKNNSQRDYRLACLGGSRHQYFGKFGLSELSWLLSISKVKVLNSPNLPIPSMRINPVKLF
jgi:hypothetical protein